ncbi:hypothetical protein ACU686_09760 [Yinghuangia aomiensis]
MVRQGRGSRRAECACTLNTPAAASTPASGAFTALVELYADSESGAVTGADAFVRALGDGTVEELLITAAYLATEHRPVRYDRTWPDREPSPGVRMLSLCRRRAGMSRGVRGVLARPARRGRVLVHRPIWNHTQTTVVRPLTPDAPEIDGVAGLHFRSYADWVVRYVDHPEEAARGAADGARFMDMAASETLFAVETVLAAAPTLDTESDADGVKSAARPPVGSGNQPAG